VAPKASCYRLSAADMLNPRSNHASRQPVPRGLWLVRAGLCLAIVICGLALRRYGFDLGLSWLVVKYGGSALWAAMVFLLVATAAPNWPRWRLALIAASIAVTVELFRLVHTPWLDEFRYTIAGALLLGRIFSLWDLLAYGAGIVVAVQLDRISATAFTPRRGCPQDAG
jgi:hypothetical protein